MWPRCRTVSSSVDFWEATSGHAAMIFLAHVCSADSGAFLERVSCRALLQQTHLPQKPRSWRTWHHVGCMVGGISVHYVLQVACAAPTQSLQGYPLVGMKEGCSHGPYTARPGYTPRLKPATLAEPLLAVGCGEYVFDEHVGGGQIRIAIGPEDLASRNYG